MKSKRKSQIGLQRMVGPRAFDDWHMRTHPIATIGSSAYHLRREGWIAARRQYDLSERPSSPHCRENGRGRH